MKTPSCKIEALLAGAAFGALFASPLARADYASTVLSQGPVGYYRLNESVQPQNSTTAANIGSLGASANGTYVNSASGGFPGPFAGSTAVSLDGVSQYVSTPWVAGLNGSSFSFEVWANPAEVPKFGYIAGSGDMASPRAGWYLGQDDGNTFGAGSAYVVRFFNQNGTTQSIQYSAPVTNAPGTWVHLVLTYDGSVGSLYMNGVLITNAPAAYVPPVSAPFTIGCRSSIANFWLGKAAEPAMYNTALSAARVAAHYNAGMTTPATYQATVQADTPVCYQRYQEAGTPSAVNSSLAGSALDGLYFYDAKAGVTGPRTPTYPGFDAANKAAAFANGGGSVRIPPLNLNTNTVTISCWVNLTNAQQIGAGIVLHGSGANACGLTIDQLNGGLGLGYIWNGNNYGWSPSDSTLVNPPLPLLPDSTWAFAALVIRPLSAEFYLCDANNFGNFASVTNTFQVNHANQAFASATVVGAAAGYTAPARTLNGAVDEVTIFNRALNAGELYTQYATAVGGVKPRIFTDLQGPVGDVAAGDPIVLTVDAGGTPDLTFTWRKVGVGTIATTTNGVLTIASAVLGDAGTYDVTISNGAGSADSQTVAVTVITPSTPAITGLEGYKDRTLYLGATLRLAVVGTGGGLKYQWYKNAAPIASATSSVYSVGVTNTSQAGSFSVSVTNSVGATTSGPPVAITIPNMASNSYAGVIISSGPEAWWRLDETPGSTNLFDGMGRHDGVYTNLFGTNPPVALGVPGALVGDTNAAASFSGNQGLGVIPYSPIFSSEKQTIEGWVRTTVTDDPNLAPFSSTYGASGEYWRTSPAGEWRPYNSTAQAPLKDNGQTNAVVVYNQWTHLVMVYDPSRSAGYPWAYYINGRNDVGGTWQGVVPNSGGPFLIGGRGVSATTIADLFWKGQVDEVTLYQRALSATEVAAHYAARGVEILPPTFSGQLLSQTVTTGKSISFSTTVFGTSPVLSWYKGTPLASAPIATGTNAIYFNPTALGDSGTYSLVASNSVGSVTNTASLTVISPVAYANVTNNLVLHLTFDTDTSDSSGRGNNGDASSSLAPAFVPGIIGAQALQYTTTSVTNNGTNLAASSASYVTLGTVGSGPPTDLRFGASTSFSVSLWVKLPASALPGDLPFIGTATNAANNPGWVLCPSYYGGGWQWCLGDGANTLDVNGVANSINNGGWHSFVLTVDRAGALAKSYLDGVLMASRSISSLGSLDNNNYWPIAIGQDPTGTYPVIAGASANDFAAWITPNTATVDDIGIWRQALTPLEVAQVASAGAAGRSFNTVAPALPALSISRSGADVVLTYSGGTLVESTDPTVTQDAWTPVAGASSPWPVTPSDVKKFYSVRQ